MKWFFYLLHKVKNANLIRHYIVNKRIYNNEMLVNYQKFKKFNENISFLYDKFDYFINYYAFLPAFMLLRIEILIFFFVAL